MNIYIGSNSRLPSEYQEVEYISSSNQQYIETGLSSDGSYLKADYKFQLLSTSSNNSGIPPFIRGPVVTGQVYQTINSSRTNFQFGAGDDDIELGSISTDTDYTVVAEWNNGTLSTNINGTTATNSYSGGLSTHTIPIFCRWRNTNDGYDVFSSIKLYYFKLYTASNTLARDLVPCYRKLDGEIGLYDLVNDTFYTNAGSGTFDKGADVYVNTLKNIYIGDFTGWQPGANTIAYWKLDGDITDQLGNYNLTTRTGSISYGTLSSGIKYGVFNGSTVLTTSSVPSWTKGTLSFWVNKSGTSIYTPFVQNVNTNSSDYYTQIGLASSQISIYSPVSSRNYWDYTQSTGAWHHIVMAQDGSGVNLYVDGTKIGSTWSSSYWFNTAGGNQLCIGGLIRGTQTYTIFNGYLSNIIIESEGWTAQEVSDYYNSTKSNYGL